MSSIVAPNVGVNPVPVPSTTLFLDPVNAATNIRYNSVKRNSHKALLPYGNKLKRLDGYISQDLKGTSVSILPPHMAKLIEGTPASSCRPKWPLLEKAHQPQAAAPNGNC